MFAAITEDLAAAGWMRPLPIVAGGASGGLVGLGFQLLRDLSSEIQLAPPDSEPASSVLFPEPSTWASFDRLHIPSLVLGLGLGLLVGPLLDLAFLLRLLALRRLRHSARLLPSELYRILE